MTQNSPNGDARQPQLVFLSDQVLLVVYGVTVKMTCVTGIHVSRKTKFFFKNSSLKPGFRLDLGLGLLKVSVFSCRVAALLQKEIIPYRIEQLPLTMLEGIPKKQEQYNLILS